MRAAIGDMLVVHESATKGDRAGEVIAVHKTLGAHPYVAVVRWVDNGYVGLAFPEGCHQVDGHRADVRFGTLIPRLE